MYDLNSNIFNKCFGQVAFDLLHVTCSFENIPKREEVWLIDCMVFNRVLSVISGRPVHLPMLSWNSLYQYSVQKSFRAIDCFPT